MNRVQRIEKMEAILNEGTEGVAAFSEALERFADLLPKLKTLSNYYGSATWFGDLAASEKGKLPEDLRCGVLSEDLAYDLLTDYRLLLNRLLEVSLVIARDA